MAEIARAVDRLAAMNIGGEDFALETGMEPTEETLLMPKQQMIFAARSGGLMPLGFIASVAAFGDWEAFGRMVRRSRQFGFMGAGCIHPGQVPIVNREYSPAPPRRSPTARRVIVENVTAEAAGRASFALDGKMIDVPVVIYVRSGCWPTRRHRSARGGQNGAGGGMIQTGVPKDTRAAPGQPCGSGEIR